MTSGSPVDSAAAVTLRVSEARVEDIGHAIARLAAARKRRSWRSTRFSKGARRGRFLVQRQDSVQALEAGRPSLPGEER